MLLQPFDLVKTRLQAAMLSEKHRSEGMMRTLVGVVRNEKFVMLWRGMVPVSRNLTQIFKFNINIILDGFECDMRIYRMSHAHPVFSGRVRYIHLSHKKRNSILLLLYII